MKKLKNKDNFVNRQIYGLPDKPTTIKILQNHLGNDYIYLCQWKPFNKNEYSKENMPGDGYLGTAIVIEGRSKGIGFHAWDQNDSEFLFYAIINN